MDTAACFPGDMHPNGACDGVATSLRLVFSVLDVQLVQVHCLIRYRAALLSFLLVTLCVPTNLG